MYAKDAHKPYKGQYSQADFPENRPVSENNSWYWQSCPLGQSYFSYEN